MKYKNTNCPFIYPILSVDRVVDGDTIDATFDLGFDICFKTRIRLLGIDTPESRTRDKEEKMYGLLSKKKLKEWVKKEKKKQVQCRCEERDSRGKFGRVLGEIWVFDPSKEIWINVNQALCEEGYAVPYWGQNKNDIREAHLNNRTKLKKSVFEESVYG